MLNHITITKKAFYFRLCDKKIRFKLIKLMCSQLNHKCYLILGPWQMLDDTQSFLNSKPNNKYFHMVLLFHIN